MEAVGGKEESMGSGGHEGGDYAGKRLDKCRRLESWLGSLDLSEGESLSCLPWAFIASTGIPPVLTEVRCRPLREDSTVSALETREGRTQASVGRKVFCDWRSSKQKPRIKRTHLIFWLFYFSSPQKIKAAVKQKFLTFFTAHL